MLRVGNGVDIHAFAPGVPLWLGGVLVAHDSGLAGHSDGDVVAHAVIDALLGAAGRGDIGDWFPSTDERWRGAPGTDLLRRVWSTLSADGWHIENVDITVVAAQPRLAPHRQAMRAALAGALSVSLDAVSLKATTSDGLGAVGRAEGILAFASTLLSRD